MKKISSITALGFLVLIVASPFIAIPQEWKNYFFMIGGLAIVVLSLLIRNELHKVLRVLHSDDTELVKDTYVENNPK